MTCEFRFFDLREGIGNTWSYFTKDGNTERERMSGGNYIEMV